MNYPITTAHYTASTKRKFVTILPAGMPFACGTVIDVSGKVEARKIADEYGAKCWNF